MGDSVDFQAVGTGTPTDLVDGLNSSSLPDNPTIYMDPAGSDTNHGLTSDLPIKTLAALAKKIRGAVGIVTVRLAAGSFALPSGQVLNLPDVAQGYVYLRGTATASGLGTRTASSGTSGSGVTFGTVTDTTGGLTTNAWKGWILRFVTGANAGAMRFVRSNTATVFSIVGVFASAISNGDTFVIEKPGTTITCTNHTHWNSQKMVIDYVDFQPTSTKAIAFSGEVTLNEVWLSSGGTLGGIRCHTGILNLGASPDAQADNLASNIYSGLAVTASARLASINGGVINALKSAFLGTNGNVVFTGKSLGVFVNCAFDAGSSLAISSTGCTGSVIQCRFDGTGGTVGGIAVAGQSNCLISTCDVSNTTGNGVSFTQGSTGVVTTLTGTGNSLYGLSALTGSRVTATNPGSNTLTGTSGDVQVGALGAKTWTLINGALAADTSDFATATPQYCVVSK